MKIWKVIVLAVPLAFGIAACGDDKKDDKTASGALDCDNACAKVAKASGNKVTVKFTDAEAGYEYVVMPYVLGSSATVLGAGPEKVSFNIATSNGSSSNMKLLRAMAPKDASVMDYQTYDLAQRTLFHRMEASKGLNQEPGFWEAVDRLDQVAEISSGENKFGLIADKRPVTHHFRTEFEGILKHKLRAKTANLTSLTTAATSCPKAGEKVAVPNPEVTGDPDDATVAEAVDGDGYCIAYVSTPVTESDKSAIKASIEAVLSRYKTVIYKNEMAPANGFTFDPIYVIVDVSDEAVWPAKATLNVAGVVLTDINAGAQRPIIYMSSDFSKLGALGSDTAKAKKTWHGTLAHETQHAIMDYFKKYVGATADPDTVAIDEGVAHFMEDVFGYGEESFSAYAGGFLSLWNDGTTPVLNSTGDVTTSSTDRGASQALIYYLASQKGGVKFTDGIVSGGGGLDFIRDVVKSKKKGPANLIAAFGTSPDWVETIGNYMGAIVLDGSALTNVAKVNEAQDPEAGIKDLNGGTDKTFGMSYNNYLDVDDRTQATTKSAYSEPESKGATKVEDLQYYQTKPLLYKVDDPSVSYVFSTEGAAIANTAVAIVRIK